MSRDTVLAVQGPFLHAWGLLTQYLEVCPDNVWTEKNGGWPVWQQMAHAVMVLDFFVLGEDEQLLCAPCDMDTLMLKVQGRTPVDKAVIKEYAVRVKARVDAWLAGLSDADLPKLNAALTRKLGRDTSNAAAVVMLASHTDYHIGSCDAALRDHGLPGVF